ncbi:MAG: bifunctional folylpolyglutamate synthase/dihydrofolate synthase [Ktedonobacteraceae bacterium]
MNYQEALAYLYSLSGFELSGSGTRNPEENLKRESSLLEALGNPQLNYTNTLIAGTKGKGSTAIFVERVLREAGIRTGLYTQPDLHTFRERMRVEGIFISEDEVAELVPVVRAAVEELEQRSKLGPFITYEVATALALYYFRQQRVQHAVIEVGLGGRLDSTNVTHPLVSVIASISYDHMQILGESLTNIATEKAGIIKPNGVVVTSARSIEELLAIESVSNKQHARMVRVGSSEADLAQVEVDEGRIPPLSYRYQLEERTEEHQRFTVWTPEHTYSQLEIPLAGQHQLENATLALAALDELHKKGISWNEQALRVGFRNVRWPARIDVVEHNPTVVVDGAHNADSMEKLLQALRDSFVSRHLILVLSLARDKDLVGIAKALQSVDAVILTRMVHPRAATIEKMQETFAQYAQNVQIYITQDSRAAMNLALSIASREDLICATGSLYLAGEVLRWAAARGDAVAAANIESIDH